MKHLFTILSIFIVNAIMAQTFDIIGSELPQLSNSISVLGDADGDGDLDLYLAGDDSDYLLQGGLYIYQDGAFTFDSDSGLPALSLGSGTWADMDGDGDQDFVLMGYNDTEGVGFNDIFINDAGSFTALNAGLPPVYMGEISVADFNNDSYLDVAFTGFGEAWISKLYKNNGDLTFSELTSVSIPGMNFGRIKFADYDNDGDLDFVINGLNDVTGNYYTMIYSNNGDETFTEETGIELMQRWIGDVEWGDFNADGNIDLAISGTGGESGMERNTVVYKNNGDGTFTNINATIMGVSHSALEWADFNGDDLLDLMVLGTFTTPFEGNYIHEIYLNNGDESFSPSTYTELSTTFYGDADSGDIDGDGKIDIVVTGYDQTDTGATSVYKNTTVVGLNELMSEKFEMYPNPNTNKLLYIDFNGLAKVSIMNLTGAIVFESNVNHLTSFDLSRLTTGAYIVSLKSEKTKISKKLIIE